MQARLNPVLHRLAAVAYVALIVICLAWELYFAPFRPGGSWLALKVLPLFIPLRGILKGNLYTLQWASMFILLYFMEGVVRVWSDPSPASLPWAWAEIVLTIIFYACAIFYLWPSKKAAKLRAKQQKSA